MAWNWPWTAGGNAVPEHKGAAGFVALHAAGEARWTRRDYAALAREGFMKNPVVHRAVRLISETAAAVPWLLSLAALSPQTQYVTVLPWTVKLHMLGGFVFIAMIPFTRLVHVLVPPIKYLWRPYQVVIWNRRAAR